jgi:hypothetical protein
LPKGEVAEPRLSGAGLGQRCTALAVKLNDVLQQANGDFWFRCDITDENAVMILDGRMGEVIERNRGQRHRVVPLCSVSGDIFAWVGFREYWQRISGKNYGFVEAGFTIHVGRKGELTKPQIMRSEWVGRRSVLFGDLIGHPHWQMDALETARARIPDPPIRFDDVGASMPAQEFGKEAEAKLGDDMLLGLTIERMHLASAAPWWRQPAFPIANSPAEIAELDRWILGCVFYIRQEIGRCEVVPPML